MRIIPLSFHVFQLDLLHGCWPSSQDTAPCLGHTDELLVHSPMSPPRCWGLGSCCAQGTDAFKSQTALSGQLALKRQNSCQHS